MKDQYFGDINDYRKYGLLRALQLVGEGRLLVSWMLTPDDGSRDGDRRTYLERPERWRRHDPELYDGLVTLLRKSPGPSVALLEQSRLLPGAAFHSAIVPDSRRDRGVWREGLLDAARGKDLVFVDPDNGLQVPSVPMGRAGSSKFVAWDEVEGLWAAGCSVLVYQHWRRERREHFALRMASDLQRRTGAAFAEAFHTSHVVFLLAAQPRHEASIRTGMASLRERWSGQITPHGLAEVPPVSSP